jgi:amino acid adenylation domain-containing protein/non-ribosomal peptide synthase protein (TIGR01720 family)
VVEWLRELQAEQAEARQYDYAPLAKVQGWSEVEKGVALFESLLVFDSRLTGNISKIQPKREVGLQIERIEVRERNNYPLAVVISQGPEMLLTIEYDRNRFESSMIRRMIEHLKMLIERIPINAGARLAEIPLLTPEEERQILVEWNNTQATYPIDVCIHHLFEASVDRAPEPCVLVCEEEQLSYRELNRRANQLAHYLRGRGVGPEVLVGLCLERSTEMIVSLIAILKAGGAYVPLDPGLPLQRLAYLIEDSGVALLLTRETLAEELPAAGIPVVCLDTDWPQISCCSEENPHVQPRIDNLAYVSYTSGTTGKPKGVSIPHRGVVRLVKESNYAHFGSEEVFLQFAPLSFDASTFEIWGSMLNGGRLVMMPPQTPALEELGSVIKQYQVSTLWLTAGLFHLLIDERLDDLRSIKQLLAGGDVLSSRHVWKAWRELKECQLINGYGPTENTTFTCCHRIEELVESNRSVPIGRPISGTQVYVLDRDQNPVPIGVVGELYISGDGLARGYLNDYELSAEKFIPNPLGEEPGSRLYRSGDLVRYLANGELEYLRRLDEQVKVRGYRIEPGEIEVALREQVGVRAAVVVAREEAEGEKRLVAYVVCEEPPPSVSELREHVGRRLPEYMAPAAYVYLERMPLTPSGKVDRRALPEPSEGRPALDQGYVAPRNQTERLLSEVWRQVLKLEQVGVHDNFFALGGDSILSIQIVARANQAGLRLTPRQLFQYQTIAELAAQAQVGAELRGEQGIVQGEIWLTPIQHWFFERRLSAPHHFNQSLLLELRATSGPSWIAQILAHLLRHHDALRLRFRPTADGWQGFLPASMAEDVCQEIDLGRLPGERLSAAVTRLAGQAQRSLDLEQGPLLRALHMRLGAERGERLLIVIHHLVVDGVSWRVLLEDFQQLYQQQRQGLELSLPPKSSSFKRWAESLQRYARSPELETELKYWQEVVARGAAGQRRRQQAGLNLVRNLQTVVMELDPQQTQALLQQAPAAYRTQITEVLLTALARGWHRWSGQPRLLLELEGHGREELFPELDLTRTVGWFTSLYPVAIDLGTATGPGDSLKRVKEQLRSVPQKGIGYGLLRYLGRELARGILSRSSAQVSFNYLGQLDRVLEGEGLLRMAKERVVATQSPEQERRYLLEFSGVVIGGQLRVQLSYSEQIHQREHVEQLIEAVKEALEELIAHSLSPEAGGYTPSDFAEFHWSEADLDEIVTEISKSVK